MFTIQFVLSVCSGPCNSKPSSLGRCNKVIGAWAMGAGSFAYPEEAGIPIGKPSDRLSA